MMNTILIYILPTMIILCIATCWFFANSEMAMLSSNRLKLKSASRSGDKRANIILALLNNPERLFGTTLVGTNLANIISTVCSDYLFGNILQDNITAVTHEVISVDTVTSCIMVPLVLIFGELYPMYVARKYPNETALRNANLIKTAYLMLYPFMLCISSISKGINNMLGTKDGQSMTRDELELLVLGKSANISKKTKKIIEDVFDINEITAADVMVHLNDVIAIDENVTVGEFRRLIRKYTFSRMPVYQNNIFNIVGTVNAVSVLGAADKEPLSEYKDKLYIVPSTKPVIQILPELKRNRKYMGVVVDEYGAACGILTLEDIVDEIIPENAAINESSTDRLNTKGNIYDARMSLDDFTDATGIDFGDNDVQTLGGIVNIALGRIGRKGERVTYQGVEFEIIEATDRVVNKIKILNHKGQARNNDEETNSSN
ncbi:MAG: HlyC/CorC family transporter [Spirochaetales bacterium]|nr:HlyC/CorC family transporter [Spirochaetales bacterium]